MLHMNCRGYAVSQFMQPEPAKYAHAPNLEAKTFMQPEQPYFQHHPGRFFYLKDEKDGSFFSAPYEPVREALDQFIFSAGKNDISWLLYKNNLRIDLSVSLPLTDALEIWEIKITNLGPSDKKISLYPYFPVGYMSWMNQSGEYIPDLNGIVCSSITPYQKLEEYPGIKQLKDKTFFLADRDPDSWEVRQAAFEGEGGLHAPSGIQQDRLSGGDARYEIPAGIMQYRLSLKHEEEQSFRFLFGPAQNEKEIIEIKERYFGKGQGLRISKQEYESYMLQGHGCLQIDTPDPELDNFVNHWLPRQIYYHGETNRLSTDPQTRNYLQDNMGISYIQPDIARQAFITALGQQHFDGHMPDGILIQEDAILKYINQVPHSDHCVWLPICLQAYLDETDDYELLEYTVAYGDNPTEHSMTEHIDKAMAWLLSNRDERGLSFINQGDWCDPMNMVGPQGKGVSAWLTMATSYALKVWLQIGTGRTSFANRSLFEKGIGQLNTAINQYFWDGQWYARGITDDGNPFGISADSEGKIFLNPQSWAMLCGCADEKQTRLLNRAIQKHLTGPYGVEMLAPSFTSMREDIGRVTQKHPGSAENGSVYNHAAAFYVFGLFQSGHSDLAFDVLRKMIPGPNQMDIIQRGQLPVFIPNYYRGAYKQFSQEAGRSSQLFNTGTVHWVYRCLIDGLFGLRGTRAGLAIRPQLPSHWDRAKIVRHFRGAVFNCSFQRNDSPSTIEITVDGRKLLEPLIKDIVKGRTYEVRIMIPLDNP